MSQYLVIHSPQQKKVYQGNWTTCTDFLDSKRDPDLALVDVTYLRSHRQVNRDTRKEGRRGGR